MKSFGSRIIFNLNPSAQLLGEKGSLSRGMREMVPYLFRAVVAVGCDGIFIVDVEKVKSDSKTQWYLDKLEILLKKLVK